MRILYVGSKDRGVRCLNALCEAGHTVEAVVTTAGSDPDAFWSGSVKEAATARDIPAYEPDDINDPRIVSELDSYDVELTVMSGYNQILGEEVLGVPNNGTINLHAGELPAYRGGSPMNWAIINGEQEGVATIHYATTQVDAGDVIIERPYRISDDDTIADVRDRTLEIFPEMLLEAVDDIEDGTVDPRSVDVSEGTYWGSRKPQDGRIRFSEMTARNVYDFVRALTHPYPGAFTTRDGERLYVWEASLLERTVRHTPGRVMMRHGDGRVVAAKDRGLVLETVQPAGGEKQPAAAYLSNGEYLQ
jgi:methionyl-tRNA formyltransferase